jgi:hypothetical protein
MQQRSRGGAIDVVVAENGDLLVPRDGLQKALDRPIHVAEARGIGQQLAQGGTEERRRAVDRHVARGQQAAHEFGDAEALRDGQALPIVGATLAPSASAERPLDAEECALRAVHRQGRHASTPIKESRTSITSSIASGKTGAAGAAQPRSMNTVPDSTFTG